MNRPGLIALIMAVVANFGFRTAITADPKKEDVVKLTKSAAAQIKKVMRDQELDADTMLRVGVIVEEKGGFRYALGFDKLSEKTKKDIQFESLGVRIIVDQKSAPYLQGTTIDFENKPTPGFRFNNPNAVKEDESAK